RRRDRTGARLPHQHGARLRLAGAGRAARQRRRAGSWGDRRGGRADRLRGRPYDREGTTRMMRTEEDLRAALASRERLAPAPEAVVVGIRRRAARRRRVQTIGVLATATLAVAAVAMVPALVLRPDPAPAPGSPIDRHAADRPDFSFTVAAGQIAGLELRPESVDAWTQTVTLRPVDGDRLTAT